MYKRRAIIEWEPHENGGRLAPPAGPRYVAPVKLTKDSPNWPHEPFGLVVERIDEESDSSRWTADVYFVAADAPHNLLEHGRQFELFEGFHCVARVKIDDTPKAEKFTRSATIKWLGPDESGRLIPFEGSRYCAPVKFEGDTVYPQIAFSLVVDRIADQSNANSWNATVHFLVDDAPHHLLVHGAKFELYEGTRCTARGEINIAYEPARWFGRTSLHGNRPQAKANECLDQLPSNWEYVSEDEDVLNYEFYRECPDDHVLHGAFVQAIAESDYDVLFRIEGPFFGYAAVHLTWQRWPEWGPVFPYTELYATFQDWSNMN